MTETDSSKRIAKWADPAMFEAEPVESQEPQVYLLEMTSDPLGSIAALSAMYTGKVTRSKEDVTDEQRAHHLREMQLTRLTTPLESVRLHFMLEGVTRAFTHQLVRNRTSAYAQESMRFAVKEDMPVALPPSLAGTRTEPEVIAHWHGLGVRIADYPLTPEEIEGLDDRTKQRVLWDRQVQSIRDTYNTLVNSGMPAEDARGLAPTNVLTRINYVTDLRTLIEVLGVRLCTQAQFEWRMVANKMATAIAGAYVMDRRYIKAQHDWDVYSLNQDEDAYQARLNRIQDEYRAIASLFRPICYKTGKCEFMSNADRFCSIRNRVQANHEVGRPASEWGNEHDVVDGNPILAGVGPASVVRDEANRPVFIGAIRSQEWMLDPDSAKEKR